MKVLKRFAKLFTMAAMIYYPVLLSGQYEKNPLLDIENEGYTMIVGKFVKIPDEEGNRPRINCMTFSGDRLFASTETGGIIYEIINKGDGTYQAEVFFNVKDAILLNTGRELTSGSWHAGLRSVAFHPDFMSNGKFYTSVMEERPADTSGHHYLSDVDSPAGADGTIIEWTYEFGAEEVDENSYRELFRVGVPQFDHPIKQIAFNRYAEPEDEDYGLLYIGHGDGNIYNNPQAGGQNNDGRGKILRIDPLETDSSNYSVPSSNPFVGNPDWLDEIYAAGMRNPHSLCFGKDASGAVHLISGDAGRDNIEEVNVVTGGENYGWTPREGTYVHLQAGGLNSGIEALPDTEAVNGYTFPAAQWSHSALVFSGFGGLSIVGGYVYTVAETGERLYLSADFPESGMVMYNRMDELLNAATKLDPVNPDIDEPEELSQAPFGLLNVYFNDDNDLETPPIEKTWMLDVINDDPDFDGSGRSDLRFGQDQDENIYITSKRNGWIYKIQSIAPEEEPDALTNFDLEDKGIIDVYPNPATNKLRVRISDPSSKIKQLNILDIHGKYVYRTDIRQESITIDINSLKPGIYYIQGIGNETVSLKRFIKL